MRVAKAKLEDEKNDTGDWFTLPVTKHSKSPKPAEAGVGKASGDVVARKKRKASEAKDTNGQSKVRAGKKPKVDGRTDGNAEVSHGGGVERRNDEHVEGVGNVYVKDQPEVE